MKCDKCKKDFSYLNDLVLATFFLRGYMNNLHPVKRLVCPKCFKFYAKLEEESK